MKLGLGLIALAQAGTWKRSTTDATSECALVNYDMKLKPIVVNGLSHQPSPGQHQLKMVKPKPSVQTVQTQLTVIVPLLKTLSHPRQTKLTAKNVVPSKA